MINNRHASITDYVLIQPEKRSMKHPFKLSIAIAVTLSMAFLTLAEADDSMVNVKAYIGGKTIDADAWNTQDGHGSIGLLTDFNTGLYGLRFAVDLFGSGSEDSTSSQVKGTYTAAAHFGVRKYFEVQSQWKPYFGGGVQWVYAVQTNDDGSGETEAEDMQTGQWLNAGVDYLLSNQITAGVDLRYATAKVELFGESVELDATAFGISLGYRW
jgi:hypothetical protein